MARTLFNNGTHKCIVFDDVLRGSGMVRGLDIEAIVPQHGCRYFKGNNMTRRFIDWVEQLRCGVDLMDESVFTATSAKA